MRTVHVWMGVFGATLAVTLAACGGESGTSPTPTPSPGTVAATVTITAAGVSPKEVTIAPGSRVTFVNNDSRSHDMQSDPHPAHSDCLALADVGFLQPNQSRTSGNFN